MRYVFIYLFASLVLSLASCSAIVKDEAEIEKIAADVVDEIVEDFAKK